MFFFLSAIICPWLNFGLPPRCPQVVWCLWGEIEPFSATLAQGELAECDRPGKNPLKYSAVAGNWTRVTGRTDSELAIPLSYHDWDVECCIIISNKKPCSGISEPLNHKNHKRSGKVWKESVSVRTRSHIEKDGCHWSNILRRILFNKWRCTNSNITDWVIDGSLFLWLNQYSKQRDGFHWLADDCWIFLYYKLLFLFA